MYPVRSVRIQLQLPEHLEICGLDTCKIRNIPEQLQNDVICNFGLCDDSQIIKQHLMLCCCAYSLEVTDHLLTG